MSGVKAHDTMGTVLSQRKDNGRLHPVAFMSASSSLGELGYDKHYKELLAIIYIIEHLEIFLQGTERLVTMLTDPKNLVTTKEKTCLRMPWESEITL
jgi:hypothetical protein